MVRLVCEYRHTARSLSVYTVSWYRTLFVTAFKELNRTAFDITVILVDEDKIRTLDAYYSKRPRVTDVLSFFYDEELYGEIFICIPQALRQAGRRSHPVKTEIARLATHGFLHLAGYDHKKPSEARYMQGLTETILTRAHAKGIW
jgi:probable rRNA maturation factor